MSKKTTKQLEVKKATQPTRGAYETRIQEFYKLLLEGKSRPELIEYAGKKWGIKRAATDQIIQSASKMIRADIEASREQEFASILKQQKDLYERILEDRPTSKEGQGLPNYGAARQVLMDRAKLMGLEKQKVVHSFQESDDEFSGMSDTELDRELSG
ncbi:MAG: hypothetical protein HC838_00055 [Spirulinaceae cyanobacterium RM2_2_10]|nr:hypothetical protein [Spirulinaceae cyanobacterium RM2_2_10]